MNSSVPLQKENSDNNWQDTNPSMTRASELAIEYTQGITSSSISSTGRETHHHPKFITTFNHDGSKLRA